MLIVNIERDEVNRVAWIAIVDPSGNEIELTPEMSQKIVGKKVEIIESKMGHELGLPKQVTWEVMPA